MFNVHNSLIVLAFLLLLMFVEHRLERHILLTFAVRVCHAHIEICILTVSPESTSTNIWTGFLACVGQYMNGKFIIIIIITLLRCGSFLLQLYTVLFVYVGAGFENPLSPRNIDEYAPNLLRLEHTTETRHLNSRSKIWNKNSIIYIHTARCEPTLIMQISISKNNTHINGTMATVKPWRNHFLPLHSST